METHTRNKQGKVINVEKEENRMTEEPKEYHKASDAELVDMWESIENQADDGNLEIANTIRGRILDEFRVRNPKAVELWENHVFPECGNLRDYVLVSHHCLLCSHFYPGGKVYHDECGGMYGPDF